MTEPTLSKRERQIMDIVFELGKASAADVHERLPDPPTYTAVRTMLKLLEDKGLVRHEQDGRKYVYSPCHSQRTEGRSALSRVLQVFFGGSLENALSAHLSDPKLKLEAEEMERLKAVIDQAHDKQCSKSKRGKK
ncbi:MAG: BlaI/MecI/CopY family transcriptional regulator [Pirellulales bacterium]